MKHATLLIDVVNPLILCARDYRDCWGDPDGPSSQRLVCFTQEASMNGRYVNAVVTKVIRMLTHSMSALAAAMKAQKELSFFISG